MSAIKFKTTIAVLQTITVCYVATAYADGHVDFNTEVLDAADRNHVDLSRFSTDNYIAPGQYLLDINVNGQPVSQQKIRYIETSPGKSAQPCISKTLLSKLALTEKALAKVPMVLEDCYALQSLPGSTLTNYAGALNITVPQAWMKYNDPNWIPPERWDEGIAGLIFDYSLNGQTTRQFDDGRNNTSVSGYGQAGGNIGAWRLRGQYQTNYYSADRKLNFDWNQIYAYRPLPTLAAKLALGEVYLDSQVFKSLRFTGINLSSDERMLPPSLQGYAPEIHGIARSNARVTVSQSGRTLYETTVPAGPFNIQDLRSSVRGTLDVRVEEQDGSVSTFQVSTASIPYLTRPGYVRYNLAGGTPSTNSHKLQGPTFVSGDFSWGVSNAWSLYGGLQAAGDEYNASSVGIGRDLSQFGAFSVDATQSWSREPSGKRLTGTSWSLNYAKTFDEYHSAISFAGYRFSQKDYRTMAQYLSDRYRGDYPTGHEKETYSVNVSKTFWADLPAMTTSLFLTYRHQNYWEEDSQDSYGLSIGRSFSVGRIRGISANLAAFRTAYRGLQDDTLSLSFSMPIGDNQWAGLDVQTANGKSSPMLSYSDNRDSNNLWRMRAGASQTGNASVDGYYQHLAQAANVSANASYQQNRFVALGTSITGGFTATRHGAALHNGSGSSTAARMMVDTNGIANVPLNDRRARTNHFGIAVVPDIVSYNSFDTRVDVDAMDGDIEASKAITTTTLTEGAIGYQKFGMAKGMKMMATVRLADHSVPPFGAEIFNADGISVAMILDDGQAWLAGVNPGENLRVNWSGKTQCTVTLAPTVTEHTSDLLLPCR